VFWRELKATRAVVVVVFLDGCECLMLHALLAKLCGCAAHVLHHSQCAYALVYPKLIDTLLLLWACLWILCPMVHGRYSSHTPNLQTGNYHFVIVAVYYLIVIAIVIVIVIVIGAIGQVDLPYDLAGRG
jgi:hypothetical protein